MASVSIFPPYPSFFDVAGKPLENGYIWIGTANLDPQTNPIAVYWDSALTIPADQPIRTLGGYPVRNGTPAQFYVGVANYSIRVQDKNGIQQYYTQDATQDVSFIPDAQSLLTTNNVSDALNALSNQSTGSAYVGFLQAGANAQPRSVQSKLRDAVNARDYGATGDGIADDTAEITAALAAQQSLGVVLVLAEGTYNISSQITQTLTAPMIVYCDGPVTLNWSSATVTTHLWKMTLAGNSFSNIGPGTLTFQCNNKLSRGIDIINDTDASRPDVDLGNMRALNLLSDNAVGFGLSVAGKLGTVRGGRLEVDGLTRTTSAGSCQGIAIYRTSFTRAPLKVLVDEVVAKNVSCPTADWDADGFLVYTNFEDGVEVHVGRASFYNCRGRGFKFQTGAAVPVIDDLYYYRDVAPVATTQSSKVGAGQYGAVLVRQATVEFAGASTHGGAGTTLFDVSHPGTDLTRGISPAMIENVTVFNNSSDSTPIELCSATYTGSDTNVRLISFKNWKIFGGSVRRVSSLLSLGQTNRTRFDIDNLIAPFALSTQPATNRGCLFVTNGSGEYLTGSIRGVINLTSDVELPLVRDYAGAENGVGQFFDGGGNRGWKIYNGAAVNKISGLQVTGVAIGNPANYEGTGFLGGVFCRTFYVSDGSTIVVPAFGYQGTGTGEFKVALHNYNAVGEYSIVGGSTTITAIRAAPSSVQIGNGSEPGSGTLRIWKNGVNGPLNLKAVGDNVYVTLVTFPV